MNITDKASVPETVMAREVGDETVILDLASGTYFGLDTVGAMAWQLMNDGKTLGEIRDAILARYEVAAGDAERDLFALAGQLRSQGLIELHAAP
jgi:hypothetical protein